MRRAVPGDVTGGRTDHARDAVQAGPGGRGAGRAGLWGWRAAGLAALLLCWPLATALLGADLVPGPAATLSFLWREALRGTLWSNVGITLWRVLLSFAAALAVGVPLGWLLGTQRRVAAFLSPWLAVGLTLPRLLILVVTYLLLGLNERAIVVAISVILVPTVAVQTREAVRGLDPRLDALSRAFGVPRARQWRQVLLPQLSPALYGTARVTLSLAWKMVVFGEVFGRTSGVGYMISFYFQQFEMRGILAYGLVMTLILSAVDDGLSLLGARAFRWRGRA